MAPSYAATGPGTSDHRGQRLAALDSVRCRAVLLRLGDDAADAADATRGYREVTPDESGALTLDVLPIRITNLGSGRIDVASADRSIEI